MRHKDANLHLAKSAALASKKQLSVLSKAISRMSQCNPDPLESLELFSWESLQGVIARSHHHESHCKELVL